MPVLLSHLARFTVLVARARLLMSLLRLEAPMLRAIRRFVRAGIDSHRRQPRVSPGRVMSTHDEAWFREEFLALCAERILLAPFAARGGLESRRMLEAKDRKIDELLDQWIAQSKAIAPCD